MLLFHYGIITCLWLSSDYAVKALSPARQCRYMYNGKIEEANVGDTIHGGDCTLLNCTEALQFVPVRKDCKHPTVSNKCLVSGDSHYSLYKCTTYICKDDQIESKVTGCYDPKKGCVRANRQLLDRENCRSKVCVKMHSTLYRFSYRSWKGCQENGKCYAPGDIELIPDQTTKSCRMRRCYRDRNGGYSMRARYGKHGCYHDNKCYKYGASFKEGCNNYYCLLHYSGRTRMYFLYKKKDRKCNA